MKKIKSVFIEKLVILIGEVFEDVLKRVVFLEKVLV